MKKITLGLCAVLSALLLTSGCSTGQPPAYPKQPTSKAHRGADAAQGQRCDLTGDKTRCSYQNPP